MESVLEVAFLVQFQRLFFFFLPLATHASTRRRKESIVFYFLRLFCFSSGAVGALPPRAALFHCFVSFAVVSAKDVVTRRRADEVHLFPHRSPFSLFFVLFYITSLKCRRSLVGESIFKRECVWSQRDRKRWRYAKERE